MRNIKIEESRDRTHMQLTSSYVVVAREHHLITIMFTRKSENNPSTNMKWNYAYTFHITISFRIASLPGYCPEKYPIAQWPHIFATRSSSSATILTSPLPRGTSCNGVPFSTHLFSSTIRAQDFSAPLVVPLPIGLGVVSFIHPLGVLLAFCLEAVSAGPLVKTNELAPVTPLCPPLLLSVSFLLRTFSTRCAHVISSSSSTSTSSNSVKSSCPGTIEGLVVALGNTRFPEVFYLVLILVPSPPPPPRR